MITIAHSKFFNINIDVSSLPDSVETIVTDRNNAFDAFIKEAANAYNEMCERVFETRRYSETAFIDFVNDNVTSFDEIEEILEEVWECSASDVADSYYEEGGEYFDISYEYERHEFERILRKEILTEFPANASFEHVQCNELTKDVASNLASGSSKFVMTVTSDSFTGPERFQEPLRQYWFDVFNSDTDYAKKLYALHEKIFH